MFSLHIIFSHRSETNLASISLRSENDGSFLLPFRIISLRSKRIAVFRFCFASFRFEAKITAVFRFFYVLFSLRSHFCFAADFYVSHRCEQAKKAPSLPFRFISLRSENDGAPYSWLINVIQCIYIISLYTYVCTKGFHGQ